MNMNPYRIQSRLSANIQNASKIREELASGNLSFANQLTLRLRYACLAIRIRRLTDQLHPSN